MSHTNRLAGETSPYLKQHEHNPVDWYPWGKEALDRAKREDKPIFLSIGYSTCHWCHVMAHESFEDETTAEMMNQLFVNIKVDREERPDLDEIYMEAVQLMTRHGGWPLSVFLTPDLKPFYGGTYYPPERKYGQPSFREVLFAVENFYRENKEEVNERTAQILDYMENRSAGLSLAALEHESNNKSITAESLAEKLFPLHEKLIGDLFEESDRHNGGFGGAPKFPQPSKVSALLFSPEQKHVAQALLTLDKIRCGGITDQLGGGVSRYSVDNMWIVPHFEKMLYDNAQILPLYSAGAKILEVTDKQKAIAFNTMAFDIFSYLERDLRCPTTGLYFAAEDADSEGEEGKFYVFYEDELNDIFGEDETLKLFAIKYFGITANGNFEGANILTIPADFSSFVKTSGMSESGAATEIIRSKEKLTEYRNKRVRPGLDSKILLGWNALAATGLLRAAVFSGEKKFLTRGLELVSSMLSSFKKDGKYYHVLNNGNLKIGAFCDDLAFLLESCVNALLITGSADLLEEVKFIAHTIASEFADMQSGTLFFAGKSEDLIVRPHKPEDNVIYSPLSAIYGSLQDATEWLEGQGKWDQLSDAERKVFGSLSLIALSNAAMLAQAAPTACSEMLQRVQKREKKNVVIVSGASGKLVPLDHFLPLRAAFVDRKGIPLIGNRLSASYPVNNLALYASMEPVGDATYSLCNRSGCMRPTTNVAEVLESV